MPQLKTTYLIGIACFMAILALLFVPTPVTATPDAVSFSNVAWCWADDSLAQGGISSIVSEYDTIQINGTILNSGAADAFRVGVRLANSTSTKRDYLFGGPTYLFGTGTSPRIGGGTVTDLNRLSATTGNTDVKESFGEVQNTFIIPTGSSGAVYARVVLDENINSDPVRLELYAYDSVGTTLQGSHVGATIAYNESFSGCDTTQSSSQDLGTPYFTITAAPGGNNPDKDTAEIWFNVGRPIYKPVDTNIEFEFAGVPGGPRYLHDFADFSYTIIDHSMSGAVVLTINQASSNNCVSVVTGGTGAISDSFCRDQNYYSIGSTPSTNGYAYAIAADSITNVAILPIAGNPWLISGHQYEVRLAANSGTSSHNLIVYNSDFFIYVVPQAVTLNYFTATCRSADVLLEWETLSEVGALGFNLFRSTSPDTIGIQLNSEMIPSQAPGGSGAYYAYSDTTVNNPATYYYTLQDVGMNGQTFEHEPTSSSYPCAPTAVSVSQFGTMAKDMGWMGFLMAGLVLSGLLLGVRRYCR